MDKWLLSKLNSIVKTVDDCLGNYRITEAARALQDFVDEMSNWYVRRSRERFWASELTQDKINAYMTLYTTLVTLAKLAAPMIPFMTEEIYQNLVFSIDKGAPESVHLCDYPAANESLIDKALEAEMEETLKIVVMGRAARNDAAIKNRQPLSVMYVNAPIELGDSYKEIIEDELNIKSVEFVEDTSRFSTYTFKPQLKTVGPKYGKMLGEIRTALATIDGNAAKKELDEKGSLTLTLGGGTAILTEEDLLIDSGKVEGYASVSDGGYTIAIDTTLTEELIQEGFVREIISKIQTMRKDAGFEVMDHITVTVSGSERLLSIVTAHADTIKHDVLAEDIVFADAADGFTKDWNINGEDAVLTVKKI